MTTTAHEPHPGQQACPRPDCPGWEQPAGRNTPELASERPANPRTYDAMLRAAFEAGYARAAWITDPYTATPAPLTYDEWRASFLPDPEPENAHPLT